MAHQLTIIGAGIGGLTTALSLKQKGFSVTVYERAAAIKPVGAGIILANNAMQVLQKLGLHQKLTQVGNRISTLNITDHQLNPLSVADLSGFEKRYGVTNLAIHRSDLQRILADEIGREHIQLSKRLTSIETGGAYTLIFDDGSTVEASVLIGADGLKSAVRNRLFSENRIRQANQICWRGICEMDLPKSYHHELNEAWGKGRRFGFVKIDTKRVYWYALANAKTYAGTSINLPEIFRDFHADIRQIIEATDAQTIHASEIADLYPIRKWHTDTACLVGDAAHATTPNLGQGACQAIEDAYVLGNCLNEQVDVSVAFRQYEQLRKPKAHTIVNRSWQLGKLAHVNTNAGVWLRNTLMRYAPQSANQKQMEMIFNLDGYW